MILYHYTNRESLPSIMVEGLNRGEAPLSDRRVVQAVNLTTDSTPIGHGLDHGGRVVTEEEAARFSRDFGWKIAVGTVFTDKLEVRLTIKLPSTDTKLKRWLSWARRKCEPGYPERLAAAAGGMTKAKTWWLYFGTVPPTAIVAVEYLKDAVPVGHSQNASVSV